jgi:hypothetical protein
MSFLATAIAYAEMTAFYAFGRGDLTHATIMSPPGATFEEEVGIMISLALSREPGQDTTDKDGNLE